MMPTEKEDEGSMSIQDKQRQACVAGETVKSLDTRTLLTLIKANHQKYFRCKQLADDVLALQYDVPLKYIMDCKRRYASGDPYAKDRTKLIHQIIHILHDLEKEDKIEKYNQKFWRIL